MKPRLTLILCVAIIAVVCPHAAAAEKPRVLVLTDIENEPDDAMSMVRFLTYTNQWDVEGLVATTSVHQWKVTFCTRHLGTKEMAPALGAHGHY